MLGVEADILIGFAIRIFLQLGMHGLNTDKLG